MVYINKTILEKEIIDNYCSFCHRRKDFKNIECLDCKIRSVLLLMDDIPCFDNFVPTEKVNELVNFSVGQLKDGCPFPLGSCPDDDDWDCKDCWKEFLNKKFLI